MGLEFDFIGRIREKTLPNPFVLLGPGDDTALLQSIQSEILITTDMLLEGSCFLLDEAGPFRVGQKAMNVNLSDIAAMAGIPLAAVVSVGLTQGSRPELAEQLDAGLRQAANQFDVCLVGGDTNSWKGPLCISVTLLGKVDQYAVTRKGAERGDWIFVTGALGGSILRHHLDFVPRVREAQILARTVKLKSMIDISDGLAKDLWHICEESQVGAILQAESIPISADAYELAQKSQQTPLYHALHDGEDFELVFTVSPEEGQKLLRSSFEFPLTKIGEIIEQGYFLEKDKQAFPLEPKGYEHTW
jgi:thiamine-monophosphate kinase